MSTSVTSLWTPRSMDIDWPRPLILVCSKTRKLQTLQKVIDFGEQCYQICVFSVDTTLKGRPAL